MEKIGLTKMSSKGQIVIPKEMRKEIKQGETLLIRQGPDCFVIRKASKDDKQMIEDMEFARRSDETLERLRNGKGIEMEFSEFIKEMRKW